MTLFNNIYAVQWENHTTDISTAFKDLLWQKELIDVTLAADGYMFDAHRLILSAISPYFRQIFSQMPPNQRAFVFMKDVSKQTLQDLITFIYSGEVNVEQRNLAEFQKTAAALKIKGYDCLVIKDLNSNNNPVSMHSTNVIHHASQYQSMQTTQFHGHYSADGLECVQNVAHVIGNSVSHQDEMNQKNVFGIETCDGLYSDDMEQQNYEQQNDDYDEIEYRENDNKTIESKKTTVSAAKRTKRADVHFGYDIIADIRTMPSGRQSLFHNNYKFTKNFKSTKCTGWRCSKHSSEQCHASVSTIEINGVVMMKICIANHTHQP